MTFLFPLDFHRILSWQWADAFVSPDQDTLAQVDPDKLQQVGETLALTLIKMVRQSDY